MKPSKNRMYCFGCNKPKMLFENESKAENFIRFNKDIILEETGKAPVRSYYCEFCSGWHVTSNPSLEFAEKKHVHDLKTIDNYMSVNKDILSLNNTISNKISEIKKAIYLSEENINIYKEYEYCRLFLPELMRLNSDSPEAGLIHEVNVMSEILSAFTDIELMELPVLRGYIKKLKSNREGTILIKRYALAKYINLSLEKLSELYKTGEISEALQLKEQLLSELDKTEGTGKEIFTEKYKRKINETFGILTP